MPQKKRFVFKFFRVFIQSIIAILEMSGILLGRLSWIRITLYLSIVAEILLFTFVPALRSYEFVMIYAIAWFIFRQAFLFTSFTRYGIASQLKKWFGVEKGGELYLHFTAFSFWYRARSYSLFIEQTSWDFFPQLKGFFPVLFQIGNVDVTLLVLIGYLFAAVGMIVNIWSYLLIERGAYYYMDMFFGRFLTSFQKAGPYKWFKNPMYGIGQLPSYGVALAAGSISGIILSFLNQFLAYVFYYMLELPHIKRCLANLSRRKSEIEVEP